MLIIDKDWNIKKKSIDDNMNDNNVDNNIMLIYVFDNIGIPEDFNDLYNDKNKLS